MTREIRDHIVENDSVNHQLKVEVIDQPGAGGANHIYNVTWTYEDGKGGGNLIVFQDGPISESGVNGVTHEALLAIVIDRLRSFQAGPFACRENAVALIHCEDALALLQERTKARIARGVEGKTVA